VEELMANREAIEGCLSVDVANTESHPQVQVRNLFLCSSGMGGFFPDSW